MIELRARSVLIALSLPALAACASAGRSPATGRASPPSEELLVEAVGEEVIVAAWAEPAMLPPGGGQAQILVRVQHRGGARFPGVQVRLRTSNGSLYSGGKVLTTDSRGMTRDRLTAHKPATITLNAGGTRFRFLIPIVAEQTPEPTASPAPRATTGERAAASAQP